MRHCPCANKQKGRHFHAKTTSAKLDIYIGVWSRDLFIDEAFTVLGIFPVFFPCMLPTLLCGIFSEGYCRYLALCLTSLVSQLISQLVRAFLCVRTLGYIVGASSPPQKKYMCVSLFGASPPC